MTQVMTALAPRPGGDPAANRGVGDWRRDAGAAAMWLILLVVTALWLSDGGVQDLSSLAGATLSLGRLTGLIASALLLMQVLLMARVPWIEQAWGHNDLTRLHRWVGFTSFTLMIAHIVLITLGYAAADSSRVWATIVDLVLDYPGMLLAAAGTLALVMVVVTSARAARRRMRYQSWHLLHLYAYLGVGLALPHQLWTGQEFLKFPAAKAFWWALYMVCAGSVVVFRLAIPAWRSLRAPIRVVGVRHDGPDVTTVTVGGPGVRYLRAQGGQYFQWRFLGAPGWTRAHPYSLSAAPDATSLRFTAAAVGEGSTALRCLPIGSRVLVEGPYGRLHPGTRKRRKVLLAGAGTGIAPLRALLESLPQDPGDVMVIHRVGSARSAVLSDEIRQLVSRYGADLLVVAGHRTRQCVSWLPEQTRVDDSSALVQMCPDVAARDVFICGPTPWADALRHAAIRAGTPSRHIHLESFQH